MQLLEPFVEPNQQSFHEQEWFYLVADSHYAFWHYHLMCETSSIGYGTKYRQYYSKDVILMLCSGGEL